MKGYRYMVKRLSQLRRVALLSLFTLIALTVLQVCTFATAVPYVFRVVDDSGAPVAGATLTQSSLKNTSTGATIAVTPTVTDLGAGFYSVLYDAETNGEGLLVLTPSLGGHTFTNQNASVGVNMTRDSTRIQTGIDSSGLVALRPSEHTLISGTDVPNALNAVMPTTPTTGSLFDNEKNLTASALTNGTLISGVKSQTDKFSFTGTGPYTVNANGTGGSDPLTNAASTYTTPGTIGYVIGQNLDAKVSTRLAASSVPTNFGIFSIDGSGRVLLQPTQTGVTIPTVTTTTNLTNPNLGSSAPSWYSAPTDPWGSLIASYTNPATLGYAVGHNLDAQISAVPTALLTRSLGHSMTVGQLLVMLQTGQIANISNSWNSSTHVLTTSYQFTGDASPIQTNSTTYPSSQVTNPAITGITKALGTVPQP